MLDISGTFLGNFHFTSCRHVPDQAEAEAAAGGSEVQDI